MSLSRTDSSWLGKLVTVIVFVIKRRVEKRAGPVGVVGLLLWLARDVLAYEVLRAGKS